MRFSTQTQEMTEISSNEKKVFMGGNIFFWLGVYIQLGTKKSSPLSATFFVLTITLSFLEFEWKILYRWKAKILDFFMV